MEHSGKHSVPSGRYAGCTKPIHHEETGDERRQTLLPPRSVLDAHLHLRDAGRLLPSLLLKVTFKRQF